MNDFLNKMQSIQNTINDIYIKVKPFYDYGKFLLVIDTKLNDTEKTRALQATLETIIKLKNISKKTSVALKNNPYLNSIHDEEKKKHQVYFITLLKHINRNHLNENNHYRYIIDLFEKKEAMSSYLKRIRNDRNVFKDLEKKYDLSVSPKMEELISFVSIIGEYQIIPLLFILEESYNTLDDNKHLKSIFSILFFGKKMQYTFYKKTDDLKKKLEETDYTFFEKLSTDTYL